MLTVLQEVGTRLPDRVGAEPGNDASAAAIGLPVRRHSDFSGTGHLNLPAPPSPAMGAVTMRTGALGRLESEGLNDTSIAHNHPECRQDRIAHRRQRCVLCQQPLIFGADFEPDNVREWAA